MNGRSRVLLRNLVRARRDEIAREKMQERHVEFCSKCGKASDLSGRRNNSLCQTCAREKS